MCCGSLIICNVTQTQEVLKLGFQVNVSHPRAPSTSHSGSDWYTDRFELGFTWIDNLIKVAVKGRSEASQKPFLKTPMEQASTDGPVKQWRQFPATPKSSLHPNKWPEEEVESKRPPLEMLFFYAALLVADTYRYVTAERMNFAWCSGAVNGLFTFIMFINDEKGDGGSVWDIMISRSALQARRLAGWLWSRPVWN